VLFDVKVFEDKVMEVIFRPKRVDVTGAWRMKSSGVLHRGWW